MTEQSPNRVRGPGHDEFWYFCAREELRLQRCDACENLNWPPVAAECERCGGAALTWERLSGEGAVVSWCTFHQSYYPDVAVPYDAIVVQLDEGPLFLSKPHGFGNAEVAYHDRVRLTFVAAQDDAGPFLLPVFERGS